MKLHSCLLSAWLWLLPLAVHAKLNVVATTPDLGSLAQEIGGNKIAVTTLAKPTEDPHFVDAKPSFILKLNRADAVVEGGAELEIGWLPALVEQARNPKIMPGAPGRIACAQGVQLLEVPGALDRSSGDIHAAGNPHYLNDPANARIVGQHIADAFCQLDPASGDTFRANLAKFTSQLDSKLAEWEKALAPYKNKQIVAYHNLWPYFSQRFGLRIGLFLEPKPGIPPTPSHLGAVISKMKADNIRVILVEPFQNRKTAEAVASNTQALVLDMTQYPGGVKGTDGGYIQLMDYLVKTLSRALEQTK